MESAYRDSRINRIWEGTNEINRLLIVDMLMRSALKGELPLFDAIEKATGEPPRYSPEMSEEEGVLKKEGKMVAMGKKMALLAAGAATQRYMDKLGNEQGIVALIADSIIHIFAMESAYLRTLKKVQKEGEERSDIQVAATQVYINDSFPSLEMMARQIFAATSEGKDLRKKLLDLREGAQFIPANTIALRRKIADSVIPVARYNLTKAEGFSFSLLGLMCKEAMVKKG